MKHSLDTPLRAVVRRQLLRQLLRPVAAFATVVAIGVAGFSSLGGIGVVDALFWLLDPTSIELHFEAHDGPETLVKAYAVVVLSGLVVAGLWIGETVLSAAFGGQIQTELKHMQIEQAVADLRGHVIICGYGTFGKTIARALQETDRDVVVIESQDAEFQRALDDDLLAIQGDARREETLTDAGVERAGVVVGAIDDSNANIQIAMNASQIAPTVRLVVRVGDETYEQLARRAGADRVIIPEVASAEQVTSTL
ncbi:MULTISPECIES: potassium channel family protein [unclassified Halobacterium]|uniref:potassium channel family protein n=1 Tax=unclassified Halobacterium TaxID=2668073 RepID=UPI001E5F165A|nr:MULTISPECIES: NAD(P)-binding protein [unclassified Halobacterium]MCD2201215.1 NAD-binding protein [Halobacterium sp. KA-4]MCD2203360.1 NAD-binding protein [Halobacterium sp. KA-6]